MMTESKTPEQGKNRSTMFKLAIIWLAIFLLGSLWLTIRTTTDMVGMAVFPQVPREGEPIIATFKLNNPSSEVAVTSYKFYANGRLLAAGTTTIAPNAVKTYKYAYENPLQTGEQLNFVIRVESEGRIYQEVLSSPPYPPQVWSSFVSFAAFSTSVMSSISTMTYYQSTFISTTEFSVGVTITTILILLLVLLELTQPVARTRTVAKIVSLRLRFNTVTWLLFIIFISMVYTRVLMAMVT